jgi:ATP-dependent Lon protease
MDNLDTIAAKAFEGYVVRKDLVRQFKGQYPVPTYVVEFLLGRYCASTEPAEIEEGMKIVKKQLSSRAVRSGEEELAKSNARENGSIKVIDLIRARLDAKTDSYVVELPSLHLKDIRINDKLVKDNDRMLTGGFYSEVDLGYDGAIAQEKNGRPFSIDSLREIQLSKANVLDVMVKGRAEFGFEEWKDFLLRSVGLEPEALSERARDIMLLRMVPFVERNYNVVELGPRGTGKSHLFEQVSPYAHLVSGGKASVAQMFVNNSNGQRGLVCQYDVVCFDEVSGISFDQKDGVNMMKGYMESGQFSRGKETIAGEGGLVMVGNFDVDVEHQQRVGHLLGPLPPEMRDDTAFMDRIHAYVPGWDIPKMEVALFTDHFGLVSDFLSSSWTHLRAISHVQHLHKRAILGGALSGRDTNAVQKTVSGLLKLTYPDMNAEIPDDSIEWALRLALESRRRVKEQQKRIGSAEFRNTHFSYTMGEEGVEKFVSTPELKSEDQIDPDPLPPGQVWTVTPGGQEENPGLYKVEVNESAGSGHKILNKPVPPKFRESVDCAIQNLYSKANSLVGDRDPRSHEFIIQLRAFDASKSGDSIGIGVLMAISSALLQKSIKGGLVIVGNLNLGGSVDELYNAVSVVEHAVEKGASNILVPVSSRRQLADLSDDMITKISIQFYTDARDALLKALVE